MRTIEEIQQLKTYCENELYSKTRQEQEEDLTYINDTFRIDIKTPHREFHSGIGREIVDAASQQIITSNPQALVEILKGNQEASSRISKELNQRWIPAILNQAPSRTKGFVKGLISRGEAYFKIMHNEHWADCPICLGKGKINGVKCKECGGEGIVEPKKRVGIPVRIITPEPMTIYGSLQQDSEGRPDWVVASYKRQLKDLIPLYPDDTFKKLEGVKETEWLEYVDKTSRYCEAGEIPITDGIEDNLYGVTNYIRRNAELGQSTPDGELANTIVSDIRFARDLIMEEAMLRSDIASILHIFAHQPLLVQVFGEEFAVPLSKLKDSLAFGAYDVNVIDNLPVGAKIDFMPRELPSAEMFQRLHDLQAEILRKYPLISAAFPMMASGRSKDISATIARRRYDMVVASTETAAASALKTGLDICNTIPDWKPAGLNKGDLNADYRITIDLKAPDPVESDRLSMQGEKLWSEGRGSIDLKTNLMEYQGKTEEKSDEIIAARIVDRLTMSEEAINIYKMIFADEAGLQDQLAEAKTRATSMVNQMPQSTPTEQLRSRGEVQTERGREEVDLSNENKGVRNSPGMYTQGGG